MPDKSSFSSEPRRQKIQGKVKTTTISMSEEQYEILRRHSYATGKSVSNTIISFLDFKTLKLQASDLIRGKEISNVSEVES